MPITGHAHTTPRVRICATCNEWVDADISTMRLIFLFDQHARCESDKVASSTQN